MVELFNMTFKKSKKECRKAAKKTGQLKKCLGCKSHASKRCSGIILFSSMSHPSFIYA